MNILQRIHMYFVTRRANKLLKQHRRTPLREIIVKDMRGHEYVQARRLVPIGIPQSNPACEVCNQAEKLEAVQRILAHWDHPRNQKPGMKLVG